MSEDLVEASGRVLDAVVTSMGESGSMREHSRFSRRAGRWMYEYGTND